MVEMIKRYADLALIYAGAAMVFGVFYREFSCKCNFYQNDRFYIQGQA